MMGGFEDISDATMDKMWLVQEDAIINEMIPKIEHNAEMVTKMLMPAMYTTETAPTVTIRNGGRRIVIAILTKWQKDGFYATSPFAEQPFDEAVKEINDGMEKDVPLPSVDDLMKWLNVSEKKAKKPKKDEKKK